MQQIYKNVLLKTIYCIVNVNYLNVNYIYKCCIVQKNALTL